MCRGSRLGCKDLLSGNSRSADQDGRGTQPPPDGLSRAIAKVERMYGGENDTAKWLRGFVAVAHVAGTDADLCCALAEQLRIIGDALGLAHTLEQSEQSLLLSGSEIGFSQDHLLNRDAGINVDRHPPQVA